MVRERLATAFEIGHWNIENAHINELNKSYVALKLAAIHMDIYYITVRMTEKIRSYFILAFDNIW